MNLDFLNGFSKEKAYISNFIIIRPVGVKFHADGRDEFNSLFSPFLERA